MSEIVHTKYYFVIPSRKKSCGNTSKTDNLQFNFIPGYNVYGSVPAIKSKHYFLLRNAYLGKFAGKGSGGS
jgi:hypothetical protein